MKNVYDCESGETLHLILKKAVGNVLTSLTDEEQDDLANMLAVEIRREHGGGRIYIPSPSRALRDAQIRAEFNGTNYAQLAEKYGITPRRTRQILKRR